MLDEKKRQLLEQAVAELSEVTPRMCWSLYLQFRKEGFSDDQSFDLVKAHLMALSATSGVHL